MMSVEDAEKSELLYNNNNAVIVWRRPGVYGQNVMVSTTQVTTSWDKQYNML